MEEIYCMKCRQRTKTKNIQRVDNRLKGECVICSSKKNRFIKRGSGWTDLPFEMHLPGYNFAGPGTKLNKRLDSNDNPLPHSIPINELDEIAMRHDICYRDNKDRKECDKSMLKELKTVKTKGFKEWIDKRIINNLIGAKHTLGLGVSD